MAEADEPKGPADAAKPPRKVAHGVPIIDSSIEGELDRLHGEVEPSQQPTATPFPPKGSPLLAPNPSHDLASAAPNFCADNTLINMAAADAGRKLGPAASS